MLGGLELGGVPAGDDPEAEDDTTTGRSGQTYPQGNGTTEDRGPETPR